MESTDLGWSEGQSKLISGDSSLRQIIEAGPGTGKTEVVCARIQTLVELQGLEPNSILVISFTNSAVDELRLRIRKFARNASFVPAIRITTLDRFAFALRTGFSSDKSMKLGDYDESMEEASNLILNDPHVKEYLSSLRHVFIDEAQDITGVRTDAILNLVFRLPKECGVTVLGDSAQAIYGFAHNDESNFPGDTLLEALEKHLSAFEPTFNKIELTDIYRTGDSKLLDIYTEGRALLMADDIPVDEVYKQLRSMIEHDNDNFEVVNFDETSAASLEDAFFIFRSKAAVLSAQALMKDKPRRLKLSGFPSPIKPWIGRTFWDSEELVTRDKFMETFEKRCKDELGVEENWEALITYAGRDANRISISRLNALLSSNNPPRIFQQQEVGFSGPIFSTIHRSKGREASEVVLFLPQSPSWARDILEQIALEEFDANDPAVQKANDILASRMMKHYEEARILFVGATRAKQKLYLGIDPFSTFPQRTYQTKRVYSQPNLKIKMCRVEIGLDSDINAEGIASHQYFPEGQDGWSQVWENQKEFWHNRNKIVKLRARKVKSLKKSAFRNHAYILERAEISDELRPMAFFDKSFDSDLFQIGKRMRKGKVKPPDEISEIYSVGATTVAISATDERRSKLHPEWRKSGLLLKPLIVGFSPLFF